MSRPPPAPDQARLKTLFREMVDIYSPSGKEEELADYLADYLDNRRLCVERQPVDESRYNLLVHAGRGSPTRLFLGHIDTVPAFDIERYDFSERDGLCHGLGTADMKSGCAALVEAFVCCAGAGVLDEEAMLALVVGEEETGDGTQALLEHYTFRDALVAEPTSLHPCLEHYGYVEMLVRAYGYRRHAALSGKDTNAIRAMLHFLLNLEDHVERGAEKAVLNIRDLHSSESGFAVPDSCTAGIDLHLPPAVSAVRYASDMASFVGRELPDCGAAKYHLDFPTATDGYSLPGDEPLAIQLRDVYAEQKRPWRPQSFRSHSDANLLRDSGCKALVLGPGQLSKAHTCDEAVAFEQVAAAAAIYAKLLSRDGRPA